ncbi:MAG: transposase [Saprospiraceae bacterium]|uniref:Transposase n=1 Tax=Candidatus Opimibacter skivensis TaxID=2982028 RepID=A0A9D7SQ16_9BACT|nr:transposase [Candidatus Opimibacter skivensis]
MVFNPRRHHRTSYRFKGHDYGSPGAYFVTANCINGEHLFGEVVNGEMNLNALGQIVYTQWYRTEAIRPNITLGAFVIMPNHIHGIIIINEKREPSVKSIQLLEPDGSSKKLISTSQTIGAIMRGFMGAVTSEINKFRGTPGDKIWQVNYWDRIIRTEKAYHKISAYILNNPKKWES